MSRSIDDSKNNSSSIIIKKESFRKKETTTEETFALKEKIKFLNVKISHLEIDSKDKDHTIAILEEELKIYKEKTKNPRKKYEFKDVVKLYNELLDKLKQIDNSSKTRTEQNCEELERFLHKVTCFTENLSPQENKRLSFEKVLNDNLMDEKYSMFCESIKDFYSNTDFMSLDDASQKESDPNNALRATQYSFINVISQMMVDNLIKQNKILQQENSLSNEIIENLLFKNLDISKDYIEFVNKSNFYNMKHSILETFARPAFTNRSNYNDDSES